MAGIENTYSEIKNLDTGDFLFIYLFFWRFVPAKY